MANNPVSISFLLMVAAGLMMTAQGKQPATILANRQPRHIFLFPQAASENDVPSIDFEYGPYSMNIAAEKSFTIEGSDPRIPNRFSRPVTSSSVYYPLGDSTSDVRGKTFGAFANLFGAGRNSPLCPQCPQCPAFPAIPPCPNPLPCPNFVPPATLADGSIFVPTTSPSTIGCATAANSLDAALLPCARASAAPKGTIDVTFTAATTSVMMAIVGATPTTVIKLTCTSIPSTFLGVTQFGQISTNSLSVTGVGFIQFLASSGSAVTPNPSLKCTWSS